MIGGLGMPQISIKHNEFSPPPVGWDRNFDDSALEFVTHSGAPVLQLVYVGDSEVEVRGILVANNTIVVVTDKGMYGNPRGKVPLSRPIFKYPSARHPHERL